MLTAVEKDEDREAMMRELESWQFMDDDLAAGVGPGEPDAPSWWHGDAEAASGNRVAVAAAGGL